MNTTQKGIITLLKSAVTETALKLPEEFDLEQAYSIVRNHSMDTLIYDGAVRCGIDRKHPTMMKLFQNYYRMMMISEGQMQQVERIFQAFDENGIDYMPLKGCKMKALYPKPELRTMGDADILIRLEQYDKIKTIMTSLGFSKGLESDHELVWKNDKLYVELHKRLIPSYNKDFYAYFGDGWQLATRCEGSCYSMTAEAEFVHMITHFARHYRNCGIGCRHLVDLWVYLRENQEMDEKKIKTVMQEMYLLEFYENVRHLIATWFEGATSNEKTDHMTDFIFGGGSWGKLENRAASLSLRDEKNTKGKLTGKWLYIKRRLFPEAKTIESMYPILKKYPWALPVVWCIRLFKKIVLERGTVARQKKMISMLNPENIQSRQEALRYVGLDYHF